MAAGVEAGAGWPSGRTILGSSAVGPGWGEGLGFIFGSDEGKKIKRKAESGKREKGLQEIGDRRPSSCTQGWAASR